MSEIQFDEDIIAEQKMTKELLHTDNKYLKELLSEKGIEYGDRESREKLVSKLLPYKIEEYLDIKELKDESIQKKINDQKQRKLKEKSKEYEKKFKYKNIDGLSQQELYDYIKDSSIKTKQSNPTYKYHSEIKKKKLLEELKNADKSNKDVIEKEIKMLEEHPNLEKWRIDQMILLVHDEKNKCQFKTDFEDKDDQFYTKIKEILGYDFERYFELMKKSFKKKVNEEKTTFNKLLMNKKMSFERFYNILKEYDIFDNLSLYEINIIFYSLIKALCKSDEIFSNNIELYYSSMKYIDYNDNLLNYEKKDDLYENLETLFNYFNDKMFALSVLLWLDSIHDFKHERGKKEKSYTVEELKELVKERGIDINELKKKENIIIIVSRLNSRDTLKTYNIITLENILKIFDNESIVDKNKLIDRYIDRIINLKLSNKDIDDTKYEKLKTLVSKLKKEDYINLINSHLLSEEEPIPLDDKKSVLKKEEVNGFIKEYISRFFSNDSLSDESENTILGYLYKNNKYKNNKSIVNALKNVATELSKAGTESAIFFHYISYFFEYNKDLNASEYIDKNFDSILPTKYKNLYLVLWKSLHLIKEWSMDFAKGDIKLDNSQKTYLPSSLIDANKLNYSKNYWDYYETNNSNHFELCLADQTTCKSKEICVGDSYKYEYNWGKCHLSVNTNKKINNEKSIKFELDSVCNEFSQELKYIGFRYYEGDKIKTINELDFNKLTKITFQGYGVGPSVNNILELLFDLKKKIGKLPLSFIDSIFSLKRIGDFGQVKESKMLDIPFYTDDKMEALISIAYCGTTITKCDDYLLWYSGKENALMSHYSFFNTNNKMYNFKRKDQDYCDRIIDQICSNINVKIN